MACPAVTSGDRFLVETLAHLDCQAQSLGILGYGSLSEPGAPAALLLTGLLTLFVAILAYRLLFGPDPHGRDLVNAVLKVGIVLTLAGSWPAFRVLVYDTVLGGPAELAASLASPQLPNSGAGFAERLQGIDTGLAALTVSGTGRQTGSLELEPNREGRFEAIALADEQALGWARTIFLGATIGSLAIVRIAGGLLLAIAPVFAGLLLFAFTGGLFAGWVRGLVLVALGSLGLSILLSIEVAILEPWLAEVLQRRTLGYATPTAPTEILALTLAFAISIAGVLFLLTKVAFQNTWGLVTVVERHTEASNRRERERSPITEPYTLIHARSRAQAIGESVTYLAERERTAASSRLIFDRLSSPGAVERPSPGSASQSFRPDALGSTFRRTTRRTTSSQTRRDRT